MGWLVIFCSVGWADDAILCPDRIDIPQAPMKGPIRSGYLRVIEVRQGPEVGCWLRKARQFVESSRYRDAQSAYHKVLQYQNDNIEALLGLATVAARQGRIDDARQRYQDVLLLDPDNGSALAGMSVVAGDDPRLLATLERFSREHPAQAQIHFAVGNLYVRRGNWPKAQTAYFQAFRLDKANPDYAYNLAVSLDRLGKKRLARRFYQQALGLAQLRSHEFDPEVITVRLNQLSGGDS